MIVELLIDENGPYGIGFSGEHAEKYQTDRYLKPLILRPDILKRTVNNS